MAFSLWAPGLSLRLPAAVHRCLANDQLFRLCRSLHYSVILPSLLRSCFSHGATGLIWRISHHAVASDQGRKGANFFKRSSASGSLILSLVRSMKIKLILKWSVRAILLALIVRSEEHTSELQSRPHLVCRLLLEKKKQQIITVDFQKERKQKLLT